jgi:hypothetical protein
VGGIKANPDEPPTTMIFLSMSLSADLTILNFLAWVGIWDEKDEGGLGSWGRKGRVAGISS